MFRPIPSSSVLRGIPYRLIASVVLVLALVVAVILLFSLEHEKLLLEGVTQDKTVPTDLFPALWRSRHDLIMVSLLLFLVGAIGVAAIITFLHYEATRRTLEEVKELARNILRSIPTGVLTVNRAGMITAVNPAAEMVLRRSSEALLGQSHGTAFTTDDRIRHVLDAALRDGRHVSYGDLSYEGQDQTPHTIRVSTADLTDDDGQRAGVILQAQDVTEWLHLEQRVRTAEKLAALHTLSAGLAHELRNPLSAMDLNLHLLEEDLQEQGMLSRQGQRYLNVLNAECRRLSVILDSFMKFARPGSISPHEVNIGTLIQHILALMEFEAAERKILLDMKVEEPLPPVRGDETAISQVLLNIIVNAFHAMPDGGLCRVQAEARKLDGKQWISISVTDTGIGMTKEQLSKMCEPFYTTKPSGTGLGLAIAHRIVQDHGGTIHASSVPGSGTTVVMMFPAAAAPREPISVSS
jgi:PAS domain S-box-containing protein